MRRSSLLVVAALAAFLLAGCGGGAHSPAAASTQTRVAGTPLTDSDLPDVLSPGIWPGAQLRAYRNGDTITIKTAWGDAGTTVDGRSTRDAALSICEATVGDLNYADSLSVTVLASNGWEHLAFKDSGAKCHTD